MVILDISVLNVIGEHAIVPNAEMFWKPYVVFSMWFQFSWQPVGGGLHLLRVTKQLAGLSTVNTILMVCNLLSGLLLF